MRSASIIVMCAFVSGAIGHAQQASTVPETCERLAAGLKLPNSTVTAVQMVPAGRFTPPTGRVGAAADLPAFCRVQLTLKPSADSDIRSEIWLPLAGWNGKFQQVGNGAWGGSIQYDALGAALKRGYAAASTDTGHTGTDASFAIGHPEKLIDFGYRAVHETAVQGKAATAALYGSAPRLSYFNGCSGGGRQAFMEAQRYPADFDGIVAGAPGYDRTNQSLQLVAIAQATHHDPASSIPTAKFAVLHRAAIEACDADDGLKDGLISDPLHCRFDPAVTLCKSGDGPDCLTPPQVDAAKKIYAPLKDSRGVQLFPGQEPGSEMRWPSTVGGARPLAVADDLFKALFQDPNWDFRTLNYGADAERALKFDGGTLTASSVELKPFVSRGGRLIMYHGWADQNISPRSSVNYYTRLVNALGPREADQAVRLYMVPGMEHCGGGEGPSVFDMLTVLEQWREESKAPAAVIASHLTNGAVDRTRPLCPYPQIARYKGTGSIDQAENFVCR
jgi:feruloyl esterase